MDMIWGLADSSQYVQMVSKLMEIRYLTSASIKHNDRGSPEASVQSHAREMEETTSKYSLRYSACILRRPGAKPER